jgi:hypothetical protein
MPRQPKTVYVHRGNLSGHGRNKTAAKADLQAQIDWLLEQTGAAVEVRFGHVIVVTANPAAAAYEYTIIWPDDLYHHGKTKAATVCLGNIERTGRSRLPDPTSPKLHGTRTARTTNSLARPASRTTEPATSLIGSAGSADTSRSSQPERPTKKRSTSRADDRRSQVREADCLARRSSGFERIGAIDASCEYDISYNMTGILPITSNFWVGPIVNTTSPSPPPNTG